MPFLTLWLLRVRNRSELGFTQGGGGYFVLIIIPARTRSQMPLFKLLPLISEPSHWAVASMR
jgi:hypothetical protein